MFTTLVASNRGSARRTMTPGTVALSLALHGALLVGAVYASVRPPEVTKEPEPLVKFLEVAEPEPPPPVETEAAPAPVGAPAFVPPLNPPTFIPVADPTQLRIDVTLYSGDIPTFAGPVTLPSNAPSVPSAAPSEGQTYQVDVLDSAPRLANESAIRSLMEREYPRVLADAGISGQVIAEFVVTPDGSVDMATVRIMDATHDRFVASSSSVIERFRFVPGRFKGEPVRVLIRIPITWRAGN